MPAGRVHDRITWWTVPWLGGLCAWLSQSLTLAVLMSCAYLFSGLMFGPDLDIYSVQYKRWGPLRWLWLPYQKLLSHRSWLSHGIMIGTCLRVGYLLGMLGAIALLLLPLQYTPLVGPWNWDVMVERLKGQPWRNYQLELVVCWVGLELGAMSHVFSDWLVSYYKRHCRRQQGRKSGQKKRPRKDK